ncbi:MAG: class I SAM-dependent methyltransferase [Gammaproteobacteria bacterium]|nr:class I SAM-dependent methyltransferase [Gammaproteobacteria bacterium]
MDEDRIRWNQRYREGAYVGRLHPTPLVQAWFDSATCKTAMDVACGTGRNARFLAAAGVDVIGVDIAKEAIVLARGLAQELSNIKFIVADLDEGLPIQKTFDLIVLVRFVDMDLLRKLPDHLKPGGKLIVEEHLVWDDSDVELAGPSSPRFRVKPGEVAAACPKLATLYRYEGLIQDPLGETAAVSQFVGAKL